MIRNCKSKYGSGNYVFKICTFLKTQGFLIFDRRKTELLKRRTKGTQRVQYQSFVSVIHNLGLHFAFLLPVL